MFDNLIALEELTTLICACQFNKLATKVSVLRTGNQVQVLLQLSINSLPLATFVRVVTPHWLIGTTQNNMLSPDLLIAVNTFDFNKPTTFIFHPRFRILVQVLVKLSQLSLPFAAVTVVSAIHLKLDQGLLQPLVEKSSKSLITSGNCLPNTMIRLIQGSQKFLPQQLTCWGSRSFKRQMAQSTWNALGGGSTNSQSYPLTGTRDAIESLK